MRRAELLAIVAVALVALGAALVGIDARATMGARTTADEPQYLLTAQSVAADGDLDISNQIAERAYAPYHEITIDRQTAALGDGREISPHDPLLPLLLAFPMATGGWWLAKATLALIAALTAAIVTWLAIRRWNVSPPAAAIVGTAAFAGLPLSAYGTQVYPEMPAAMATAIGFAALTSTSDDRRRIPWAFVAVVTLPWLAVKYVPVAAVLAIAALLGLDEHRQRLRLAGVFGVAGAIYLALHRAWYGGWTVYATGDHFAETGEFSVVGTDVDLIGRSRRLAGLLIDRDFGLAAWSPVWLLLPVAVGFAVHRRPSGWILWVTLLAAGWLNATFVALTMHGWWVPGRQIVVVLPIATIGIALLIDRRPWLRGLAAAAGAVGAINWTWLAVEASTGRRTLVVDFMETAALPYRVTRTLLPSGLNASATDTALLALWSAIVLALAAFGLAGRSTRSSGVRR